MSTPEQWQPTACVLCSENCGIEGWPTKTPYHKNIPVRISNA